MKKVLKSLTMVLLVLTVIIGGVGCNKKIQNQMKMK